MCSLIFRCSYESCLEYVMEWIAILRGAGETVGVANGVLSLAFDLRLNISSSKNFDPFEPVQPNLGMHHERRSCWRTAETNA